MKNKKKKALFILLLIIISIAVCAFYFLLAAELLRTKRELRESRLQIYLELRERQDLEENLKSSQEKLVRKDIELENTRRALDIAKQKLDENIALLNEKESLAAKFKSLTELKKAISEIKLQIKRQKEINYITRQKMQEEIDAKELAEGNRGFLVKNGKSLYEPKVRIEVKPAY